MTKKQAFWRQRNFAIMRIRGMLAYAGYLENSPQLLESERKVFKTVNKALRELVSVWPENSKKVKIEIDSVL